MALRSAAATATNPKRILLVEDNAQLNAINARALRLEGYEVLVAMTVAEARAHVAAAAPDLVLLDVLLPDGSGVDFCAEIRPHVAAPVIFLTSVSGLEAALAGLKVGGDDYLTKPFSLDLLIARIAAFFRRDEIAARVGRAETIRLGPLVLNLVAGQASANGADLLLTPKQFALLVLLARNESEFLTKEYLYEHVWNRPFVDNPQALWVHVSRLRKKLEPLERQGLFLTIARDRGYSLRYVRR